MTLTYYPYWVQSMQLLKNQEYLKLDMETIQEDYEAIHNRTAITSNSLQSKNTYKTQKANQKNQENNLPS